MDKIQRVMFDLLVEVDEICRKNNLRYFLGKGTALQAVRWGRFPENCRNASVFMPADDYETFERIVTSNPPDGRAIESLLTNPYFPYVCMRFVDTSTTCISLCTATLEENPGIAIYIAKLVPCGKHSYRKLSLIKAFGAMRWAIAFNEVTPEIGAYKKRLVQLIDGIGEKAVSWLYQRRYARPNEQYSKVYVQRHFAHPLTIDARLFSASKTVCLEGHSFSVPEKCGEYLCALHGRRWATQHFAYGAPGTNLFVDPDTPYSEYLPLIKQRTSEVRKLREARQTRSRIQRKRQDARKPLDACQHYYERAVDRVKMADLYLPRKPQIMNVYREGDFEQLAIEMLDYQVVCEKYSRYGLEFAFDKDLYVVMCDVLAWERLLATRKRMIEAKGRAFAYLDDLNSLGSVEPTCCKANKPIFQYAGKERGFERRDGSGQSIPVATSDQLNRVNATLRVKNGDCEAEQESHQDGARGSWSDGVHDGQGIE